MKLFVIVFSGPFRFFMTVVVKTGRRTRKQPKVPKDPLRLHRILVAIVNVAVTT